MRRAIVRPLVALLLMLATAALSVFAVPTKLLSDTRPAIQLEGALPKTFAGWTLDPSVVPIPPSPDQAAVMNQIYDQVVSRTYINAKGQRVMMSITYGSRQNQQMRAHRQEVCYRAQGFRIADLQRLPLQFAGHSVPSARMVASQGPRVEPVTYWFTMGDFAAMSYVDRELVQLRYAAVGQIPDGYLIRISNLSADTAASFALHQEFADALLANIAPELRQRLTGQS